MWMSNFGEAFKALLVLSIIGFLSGCVGVGYLIYWLIKHVQFV
jgi:NhaP-type Na+/H+ or K+/H+ antiporter